MSNLPQRIFNGNDMLNINNGQKALFLLICKKVKQKTIVDFDEARNIYITEVQMSEYTNQSYYDHENGEWKYKPRRYNDWEIDNLTQSWLLRALGTLIKKGYLMVLPRIEFSKAKELE